MSSPSSQSKKSGRASGAEGTTINRTPSLISNKSGVGNGRRVPDSEILAQAALTEEELVKADGRSDGKKFKRDVTTADDEHRTDGFRRGAAPKPTPKRGSTKTTSSSSSSSSAGNTANNDDLYSRHAEKGFCGQYARTEQLLYGHGRGFFRNEQKMKRKGNLGEDGIIERTGRRRSDAIIFSVFCRRRR